VIRAGHLEQVLVDLGEVDELLAPAFDVGTDHLQTELIGQALGVGRRLAAAVRVVSIDRHVVIHVERIAQLRRQIVVEPLTARGVGVIERVVGGDPEFRALAPLDREIGAPRLHVFVRDILADVGASRHHPRLGDHLAVTVMLQVGERDAKIDVVVDHRGREVQLFVVLPVIAAGRRYGQRRGPVDIASHVFDRAGDGILPVESALRTAQDFEVLDIDHIEQCRLRAREVHVIDVHPNPRLIAPQRVALSYTADIDVDGAAGRAVGRYLEVRHEAVQVIEVRDVLRLYGGGADRSDRDGNLLQVFRVTPRGDHHLLDAHVRFGSRGGGGIGVGRHCTARQKGTHP
jgi:hypothetical protein